MYVCGLEQLGPAEVKGLVLVGFRGPGGRIDRQPEVCLEAGTAGTPVVDARNACGTGGDVVLDAEFLGKGKDPWGNLRYAFHATTKVNRKDFGMQWNEVVESGGVLVGDEIEITLDVEAVPAG
jgi:hypothetical protein